MAAVLSDEKPAQVPPPGAVEQVLSYHERSKHRLERYAAGPETLDWAAQPDPFRLFAGTSRLSLPLTADRLTAPYSALGKADLLASRPIGIESISLLLELSLGLSAWKQSGPERWALRCNPSSGNLHPTEAYLLCHAVPGLEDGAYHYVSRDHCLEQRYRLNPKTDPDAPAQLLIGLSSVQWREAWKYGERAFRYCQIDIGHAVGALRYAAAALGWKLKLLEGMDSDRIADWLGLNRDADFAGVETEEPELLLAVAADPSYTEPPALPAWDPAHQEWRGQANRLDPHPLYRWPAIDQVAAATRTPPTAAVTPERYGHYPPRAPLGEERAATLIRRRRSAQRFDREFVLDLQTFYVILDSLLPRSTLPWDVWDAPPRLHPVLFVHRVADLAPGLYILPRHPAAETRLRAALSPAFSWTKPRACPAHLPLFRLGEADCRAAARTISCHQAIASDGAFTLGMLAEFEDTLRPAPWRYRQLHWEAGLIGQVLYLEAEAVGVRGTGIGCYFDDVLHEVLGLAGRAFQSLYHFTIGHPLADTRVLTLPPYPAERPL